jgi:hypothetical protein
MVAAAAWPWRALGADQGPRAFAIAVADGKVAPHLRILKATHQAEVELVWSVDRPMTIHLEGYDISVVVRPDAPQAMRFKAFATGRFPVHAHEGDKGAAKSHAHGRGALLRLEVHPP